MADYNKGEKMLTQREMFEAGWEYGTQRVTEYGDKCPDFPEGCGLPGSKPYVDGYQWALRWHRHNS